ncbi:hypothetical protein DAPPUDRAFT_239556 [Daphnia pulex]|uniref:Uncharacterized protein n=1 Tax=Daphnia pulex TaxID=6669 RepID=E9G9L4_DAPPU|nr:hypothetical protein DAPPUDRAFT_239556 [Daphnia pulex]|eukprot:EFX83859.1 hypothetical protein DAPPUDRAFT_239556 [Daphnia pulex]
MQTRSPRPDPDIAETPVFAYHSLDVMARPLHDNWIQPSGVFASAAMGIELPHGLHVHNTVALWAEQVLMDYKR